MISRRQFLAGSALTALGLGLSQCSRSAQLPSDAPTVIRSVNGSLRLELTARLQTVTLAGRRAQLMAYNGQVPGPRLEVQPGDRVEIQFINALTDSTNLHFHGLHIPPTGAADNIFLEVPAGGRQTYTFEIPADHPPGLFWYHPHYHGQVAAQVFGGLAGAIVVRSPEASGALPPWETAPETILVLQDFDLDRQGRIQPPSPMLRMWGRRGGLITLNGQAPGQVLTVPQDGILRLRVLNASASRLHHLQLVNHPWWLAGTDGGAVSQPIAQDTVLLAPGNRVDVLIPGTADPSQSYELVSLPYDPGFMSMAEMMGGAPDAAHGMMAPSLIDQEPRRLATVQYGDRQPLALPETLRPVDILPEPETSREFVLDHGIDAVTGAPFLINGQAYRHGQVNTTVVLDTVEDWVLINRAGLDHPFHLHTNAFQVVARNGEPIRDRQWLDVVNVPAYETVTIRIPFRDYPGRTVYHCHVLDHEDQGMMGVVEMT